MVGTRFGGKMLAIVLLLICLPARGGETVTFGVITALTGNNVMVGEFIKNGATLAQKHINERGGILGKELKLVFEDEVDNLQSSVNAMTKLLNNPEIIAFFGSTYSSYCIAISPMVLEKKMTMLAGGSSANIPKEKNPYVWQARMTDDKSGLLLAKTATEVLNLKNPAIVFIADSFGTGLKDQTVLAFEKLGFTINPKNIYAHNPDEKQFGPIISQIQHSDVDSLIAITHQMPASIFCMQVEAAGLDIPLLGSPSFSSVVVMNTAGPAANGWYAVTDWTPEVTTPTGKAFTDAYRAEYPGKPDPDLTAVVPYESVMLFAEACRIAGSTTDREAINQAFTKLKAFKGAMTTYTYAEDHCLATSQFLTFTEDQKPLVKEIVFVREP